MTQKTEIYKCEICGNIVEAVHGGAGTLVCCGQNMERKKENYEDASLEKHVPVVEKITGGIRVRVGSVDHPMEGGHYIEWIELIYGGKILRANLNPGDQPVAEFQMEGDEYQVRAYCNLHGLWRL